MIIVNFENNEEYKKAYGLWQYDYGQVLRIQGLDLPTAVEMHFSLTETGGEAVTRIGITKDGVTDVTIPDSLLEADGASQDYQIYVFIYLATPDSGETTRRITLGVKSRPRPEVFDTPGEEELFEGAVQAVNDAAKRAEEAGKEATAAAGEARESASQAGKYLTDTQVLAEQVEINADAVAQGTEAARELLAQTQEVASNAVISAQAAKQAEMAAREAQTAAESAEDAARQYAAGTEADRQEVAEKKQSVTQMQSNVARMQADVQADREAVEQTVSEFGQTTQDALTALGQAQNTAVSAVTEEGQRQATTVQETGAQAIDEIDTAKTAAVGAVASEGDKQVVRVQEAAAEIVADREQIQHNKADIATLTDKTNTLAPGIALGAKGGTIAVDDAAELPPQGLTVYGRSEQLVTTGANLFDYNIIQNDTSKGITVEYISEEQCFLINGTSEFSVSPSLTYLDIPVDESDRTYSAKTYVLSGSVTVPKGGYAIAYFGASDELNKRNNWLSVELSDDNSSFKTIECNYKYISAFWFYFTAGVVCNNLKVRVQLSKGSKELPWEPYTGGKPSPSMEYPQEVVSAGDNGKIEVEVFGANICPVSSETTNFMTFTKVYPGVPYSICAKQSIPTALNIMIVEENDTFAKNPIEVFNTLQFVKGVITFEPTKTGYVYVNSYKETEYSGVCIYAGTLLEYQYEPYKPAQTLTLKTPNGLPGIPVKSGGNYTDSTGQRWVCDEIDLSEGERVQRIKAVNAKDLDWRLDPTGNIKRFSVNNISDIRKNGTLMSNRFVRANYAQADNTCSNEEDGKLRVVVNSTIDTVDKVKQLFAENDTVFHYELTTPIRTPLSPEEIASYKALHTYAPNTTIINDAGCGMSLTYIADTQRYIDKKIAAISAAMIGG